MDFETLSRLESEGAIRLYRTRDFRTNDIRYDDLIEPGKRSPILTAERQRRIKEHRNRIQKGLRNGKS